MAVSSHALNVFINCPFDDDFKPCFEVLIFTVAASGYRVRCALEENDAGDIRLEKLCRLIDESDRSVHDLSRVQLNPQGLPRFNMPFELGLFLGAKRFGGRKRSRKSALVMMEAPYSLPVYLSDAAGSDPEAHRERPEEIIRIVRAYLHRRPDNSHLPGAQHMLAEFVRFKAALPGMARSLNIAPHEPDPMRDYRDYIALMIEFLLQA